MSASLRALIIEDSRDDAELLVRELTRGGYAVAHHRIDTPEGLASALDEQAWDIAFADYSMPQFSGAAALRMIRERGLDIPFIFVSGTIGETTAIEALKAGADDYLIKGSLVRLLPAVSRGLREAADRRERRRLQAEVLQAQKLESIGQLAGGVAHDFNNLLTIVLGNAELLSGHAELGEEARGEVEEIRAAAERARQLTHQLLAFSRRQVLDPRPVRLDAVVREMERMLRRLLGEPIEVRSRSSGDVGPVFADAGQLQQVLLNLAVNARDAMPHGGTLTLHTRDVDLTEADAAKHPTLRPGRFVELAVTDTGVGMPAELVEHIFEPFFTTKPKGEGTGLGLATVYGIVTQSGGHVLVESQVDGGTTFRVRLPRFDGEARTAPRPPPVTTGVGGGSESLLVVEDDPRVRAFVVRVLRAHGYAVTEAEGAEGALRVLQHDDHPVDLLLTDVVLPGMGGRALADQVSAVRPRIRVLYMSGHAEPVLTKHGVLEPGVSLLEKPFTGVELARRVREALDRRS